MMPKKKSSVAGKQKALRAAIGRVYDPRTGALVKRSVAAVRKVAKEIERDYVKASRQRNKAWRQLRVGAKQPSTLKRYEKQFRDAAKQAAKLSAKLQRAQEQVQETKRAVDEMGPARKRKAASVLEIGVSYTASKDVGGIVNFNIRIEHKQKGRGLTDADAMMALNAIASGSPKEMPSYLKVSSVDWAWATKGAMKEKRDQDGENAYSFEAILNTLLKDGYEFRIGEVKPDVIGL